MSIDSFPPLPDEIQTQAPPSTLQNALSDDGVPATGPPITGFPPFFPPFPMPTSSKLKNGTWLFTLSKTPSVGPFLPLAGLMDGTFRFESTGTFLGGIRASGDMYRRSATYIPRRQIGNFWIGPFWIPGPPPAKDQGIPIFPIGQYEGYLRVTSMSLFLSGGNTFDIEFDKYKWDATTKAFAVNAAGAAVVENTYVARLTWTTSPAGWTDPQSYLEGDVKIKSTGETVGRMQMGWVSDKWRKIGVEIDAVRGCYFPVANAARKSIWSLLEDAGFQLSKKLADENSIPDTPTSIWTDAELHANMLAHRQAVNLDLEWTYHAFMMPHYTDPNVLGIMYDDVGTGDSNNIAREGFAVAALLQTGDAAQWGTEANRKLQDAQDSFVRTTIHELSHALGIMHPDAYTPPEVMDDTYSCQTWSLTQHASEQGVVYPSNIRWSHSPSVQKRLRHYPDIRIRPGGVQFSLLGGVRGAAPWVPSNDVAPHIPGFAMEIEPVLGEVPLGAPVRVEVTLRNDSESPIEVPKEIGLKGEAMKGDVQDSNGLRRPFSPFIHCSDTAEPLATLDPGNTMKASLTLFGGKQGPLFPSTGVHTINTILSWVQHDGHGNMSNFWLDAKTTVMVTGAHSASHAAAAHRLLAEPQTQLSIVLAGDHLKEGVKAIQQACEDEVLGPHYACIEARRCGQAFMSRKPDLQHAKKLVGREGCVMSQAEKKKMDHLFRSG